MTGRLLLSRAEPGFTLPAFERLAPPPARELVDARIEAGSEPGDVVADLFGRGGWVARAAIDRNRRGFSLESSPLSRLLAEVVLRPPDLRHLDAAFSTLSASPQGETSLRLFIADLFATKCVSCGRTIAADELDWREGQLEKRSEEHTSELQSRRELVCRLLLEKKKSSEQSSLRYETSIS